jgi:hypothetical protein
MFPPSRIVCLTEETVETLYLLGVQDRIVGISGYVVRPPQARREKPRVSAFTSANIDKILALKPDPVLTFSDLQADIAADLIRRGVDVHAFNQRSMADQISRRARTSATAGANPVLKRDRCCRLSIGVCGRRAARKGGMPQSSSSTLKKGSGLRDSLADNIVCQTSSRPGRIISLYQRISYGKLAPTRVRMHRGRAGTGQEGSIFPEHLLDFLGVVRLR